MKTQIKAVVDASKKIALLPDADLIEAVRELMIKLALDGNPTSAALTLELLSRFQAAKSHPSRRSSLLSRLFANR